MQLLIDQVIEFFKKTKSIFSWKHEDDGENYKDNNKNPVIPIIVSSNIDNAISQDDNSSENLVNNIKFHVRSTTTTKPEIHIRNNLVRKFANKFMRRNKKAKGRGA